VIRFTYAAWAVVPLVLVACGTTPEASSTTTDGGSHSDATDAAAYSYPAPDAGAITAFSLAPLTLVPPFSPTTFDYYVRCPAAQNPVTLTTTDALGSHSSSLVLVPDQALVVGGTYSVRCLPADFPTITVVTHADAGAPTSGYYLLNSSTYGMVLDTNGTPIWYTRGTTVVNVDSPEPNVITVSPNNSGFDVHALATLTTTSVTAVGSPTDPHDLRLLPNGDWLLFTNTILADVDLTGLASFGSGQSLADCMVQELDAQENVVWSWTASDHVDPVQESLEPVYANFEGVTVVDAFHCNSIDVDGEGNLLLSLRHTNAVFYVDRASGEIEWKLGGTAYNKDGAAHIAVTSDPEGTFSLQHDARFTATGGVTLFDDHGATAGVARGVEYAIDQEAGTASVVWEFLGPSQSGAQGSFRRYPDGHSVIGWGALQGDRRVLTEVDGSGNDVLDVSLSGQVSYRAIKVPLTQLDIGLLRLTAAR